MPKPIQVHFIVLLALLTIAACGGGGNDSKDEQTTQHKQSTTPKDDKTTQHKQPILPKEGKPGPVTNIVALAGDGNVNISWQAPTNSGVPTYYKIDKTIDNKKTFTPVNLNVSADKQTVSDSKAQNNIAHLYRVTAGNNVDLGEAAFSSIVTPRQTNQQPPSTVNATLSFASPNDGLSPTILPSSFSRAIAYSPDGTLLAITEYNGNPLLHTDSGVLLFSKVNNNWDLTQTLISNVRDFASEFGSSLAFSADGFTLAIAASSASANSNTIPKVGVVEIYTKATNGRWEYAQTLSSGKTIADKSFGTTLTFSSDGYTLAISEISVGSTDINNTGTVYLFKKLKLATIAVNPWTLDQTLTTQNASVGQFFGISTAFSADGTTLAIGETRVQNSDAASVQLFTQSNTPNAQWQHLQTLRSATSIENQQFGISLAFNANSRTLAVGETKAIELTKPSSVQLFIKTAASWTADQILSLGTASAKNGFGIVVAFSPKTNLLAVSDVFLSSVTRNAGMVYLFKNNGTRWNLSTNLIAQRPRSGNLFGSNLVFNPNDNSLTVGELSGGLPGGGGSSGLVNIFSSSQF